MVPGAEGPRGGEALAVSTGGSSSGWSGRKGRLSRAPLCRANEIAQARSKAQAEALAVQARLQKEQLRVQSLEKALEQKVGAA